MKRLALIVYVNLDLVPGAFHTAESALEQTRSILTGRIGHYNPTVEHAPDEMQPEADGRIGLVVYIDQESSVENPKNFALRAVRISIRDAILHYNPVVSYAPRRMQPEYAKNIVPS
jgi:hypothetical protein